MLKTELQPSEIFKRREELGLKNSVSMLTNIIEIGKIVEKRKEAIKYLSLISNSSTNLLDQCFETIENVLISDDVIEIKCEAAKALGKIGSEKGLKPLKWILEQDPCDIEVKIASLKSIQKIRFEEPEIKLFIKELDNEFNSVKEFISIQLLSLNPEILISKLLDALKDKKISNQFKLELIKLIGYELSSINISFEDKSYLKVKYPEILMDLSKNKILLLEVITQILREEDSDLMISAVSILKILGHEIEEDIIKLLLLDDFIVKKNAIVLCGQLKLKEAVDLLITNLDNIYNEVSIASIEALGEIGDLAAIPELLNVLDIEDVSFEYSDLDMRFYILDAIKNIYSNNKNASYEHLYNSLGKDNNTIRESVAFILGEIGKEEFVKPLCKLLGIKNLDVRKNTIIALGKIGNMEPLDPLLNILNDDKSYWLIKKVAIDAIYNIFQTNWYRMKDDEIRRKLNRDIAIMNEHLGNEENENFKVKLSLIKVLETFGGEHALGALMKRVNDFHRVVRIHASNAIKRIEERLELENS